MILMLSFSGNFNVKKFIASTSEGTPGQLDTAIPGVYETRSKVFLNMAQSLIHFPNSFRGVQGGESIHTLKALVGLGQCGKSTACHSSFVKTKNEGVLQSKCIKQNWSSYDIENETAHMSHFIVNRFEKIQNSTRVLYVILEFLRKLLVKVR